LAVKCRAKSKGEKEEKRYFNLPQSARFCPSRKWPLWVVVVLWDQVLFDGKYGGGLGGG